MINYLATCWEIIVRPIYFYTRLKDENWKESPLSFFLVTCWTLGFLATAAVFAVQYVPIGSTLIEGIVGLNFLIISPVLVTLALVFFMITFLILGGFFSFGFFIAFFVVGYLLHYIYVLLGGKGSVDRMVQSAFYSSAILLAAALSIFLMIPTKYGLLSFQLYRVGFNLNYYFIVIYIYGLWAIAARKCYKIPRWKAFTGALLPIIILLILGVLFDKIALPILEPWIS